MSFENFKSYFRLDMSQTPAMIVFDLDSCIWTPEMYQTAGKPFSTDGKTGNVRCKNGTIVRLMGDVREILSELRTEMLYKDSIIAIASRGDSAGSEMGWADDCLSKFRIGAELDIPLITLFHQKEIYAKNKKNHFEALKRKSKVEYSEMIFFDDKLYNLRDVAKLGVTCVYTPHGITRKIWKEGMDQFPRPGQIIK